ARCGSLSSSEERRRGARNGPSVAGPRGGQKTGSVQKWPLCWVCACADAFQTPLRARDNCIGVGAHSLRDRGPALPVSGLLAGMFPAWRGKTVHKSSLFSLGGPLRECSSVAVEGAPRAPPVSPKA